MRFETPQPTPHENEEERQLEDKNPTLRERAADHMEQSANSSKEEVRGNLLRGKF
jgi:hypothetical protein